FAPFSHVMNEFKETQIERQFLLGDPSMGAKPRPQQGPKALDRVDMELTETIPVFITGELPRCMAHRPVGVAPVAKPAVDVIFIGINYTAFNNRLLDQGT